MMEEKYLKKGAQGCSIHQLCQEKPFPPHANPRGRYKWNRLGPGREMALKEKRHLPGDHLCRDSNPEPLD